MIHTLYMCVGIIWLCPNTNKTKYHEKEETQNFFLFVVFVKDNLGRRTFRSDLFLYNLGAH